MTQAQQKKVMDAQSKFFADEAAATSLQGQVAQAAADVETARQFSVSGVLLENAQRKSAADAAYFAKLDAQQKLIAQTQAAWSQVHQDQLDISQANLDSLQTGAVEQMPPPVPQPGGIGMVIQPSPQV